MRIFKRQRGKANVESTLNTPFIIMEDLYAKCGDDPADNSDDDNAWSLSNSPTSGLEGHLPTATDMLP